MPPWVYEARRLREEGLTAREVGEALGGKPPELVRKTLSRLRRIEAGGVGEPRRGEWPSSKKRKRRRRSPFGLVRNRTDYSKHGDPS